MSQPSWGAEAGNSWRFKRGTRVSSPFSWCVNSERHHAPRLLNSPPVMPDSRSLWDDVPNPNVRLDVDGAVLSSETCTGIWAPGTTAGPEAVNSNLVQRI